MSEASLVGKTALVTGASQGIGKATAFALASDGAAVVIMGRSETNLTEARNDLRNQIPGAQIEMYVGNAGEEYQLKNALAFSYGLKSRLDIICPIVGGAVLKPLLMREVADVRAELDLNFITVFLAIRHGAPMLERGGSIVCVSSVAAVQAGWAISVYGAAKAAVEKFVKASAFELGGAGIRVNAVRPGLTMSQKQADDPNLRWMADAYRAETPLGRIGSPEDVAKVVRFLAGPESDWVTGQILSADGGMDQGKGPDFMDTMFGDDIMDKIRAGQPAIST